MKNKKIIILDFNRTIYDPEKNDLVPDILLVLKKLSKNPKNILYLLSRDEGKEKRKQIIKKFNLEKYFQKLIFLKEKNPEIFQKIMQKEKINPKNIYIIGDYLYEEIRFGNMNNMNTIWFKNGKFKKFKFKIPEDQPNITITKISEILNLNFF